MLYHAYLINSYLMLLTVHSCVQAHACTHTSHLLQAPLINFTNNVNSNKALQLLNYQCIAFLLIIKFRF